MKQKEQQNWAKIIPQLKIRSGKDKTFSIKILYNKIFSEIKSALLDAAFLCVFYHKRVHNQNPNPYYTRLCSFIESRVSFSIPEVQNINDNMKVCMKPKIAKNTHFYEKYFFPKTKIDNLKVFITVFFQMSLRSISDFRISSKFLVY